MIRGVVNAAYEPVLSLVFQGPSGRSRETEAVVDTGFNGYLTLSSGLVTALGLPRVFRTSVILADGSEAAFDVYRATVQWDGITRQHAYMSDTVPPVGMRLMDRHRLYIDVENGGRVLVQARR